MSSTASAKTAAPGSSSSLIAIRKSRRQRTLDRQIATKKPDERGVTTASTKYAPDAAERRAICLKAPREGSSVGSLREANPKCPQASRRRVGSG